MYRQENRGPRPEETRLTQIATHIAGIAIERQRQQEILRERDARISLAAESADLAFWVLYPEQNTAWMSEKGRLIYGFDSNLPLTCDLILSRVHPDERAAVKASLRSCVRFPWNVRERTSPSFAIRKNALGDYARTLFEG